MIVKNEEKNILDCILPIKSCFDEIIVVDTGSTDKTKELLNNTDVAIFDFDMENDFSNARNYSLEKAHSDWILVLDADERLSNSDIEKIRKEYLDADVGGYFLKRENYVFSKEHPYYTDYVLRLFRNRKEIRYTGRVHEKPDESIRKAGLEIREAEVVIKHFGCLKRDIEKFKDKSVKYIELIKEELKLKKNDFEMWYVLGTEYYKSGELVNAADSFQRSISLHPGFALSWSALGISYGELKDFNKSKEAFNRCIEIEPYCAEHYYNLATLLYKEDKLDEAIRYLQESLKIKEAAEPYYTMAMISYRKRDIFNAILCCKKSIELDRGFKKSYLLLIKIYIEQNKKMEAREYLKTAHKIFPDDELIINTLNKLSA
ncbi:MAG: glycosyltransferase [Candidatus Hydrogenedentota bacterium]